MESHIKVKPRPSTQMSLCQKWAEDRRWRRVHDVDFQVPLRVIEAMKAYEAGERTPERDNAVMRRLPYGTLDSNLRHSHSKMKRVTATWVQFSLEELRRIFPDWYIYTDACGQQTRFNSIVVAPKNRH